MVKLWKALEEQFKRH